MPRPPQPGGPFGPPGPRPRAAPRPSADRPDAASQYGSFRASLLFCGTCREATPTRERLLLVLPTGNLYEYICTQCGASTGSKTDKDQQEGRLFAP